MLDLLKKTVLLGLGVLDAAEERGKALMDELVKRGHRQERERQDLVQGLRQRLAGVSQGFDRQLQERLEALIKGLGLVEASVERLEQRLQRLERRPSRREQR